MTYQPYPTGGGANQMGVGERPPQPKTLRNAVRLMLAGAALALIGVIITLVFSGKIKTSATNLAISANRTAAREHKTQLTAAQIHSLANAFVDFYVIALVISLLLWVLMAWANNRGSNWARIVGTILFGLNTLLLIFDVGRVSIVLIFIALGWLIGLGAIVLLWNRQTTQYINPGRTR